MIADVWTMAWKEWREFLRIRGSLSGTILTTLVPFAVLGIFLPLQFGRAWLESPVSLMVWGWIPLFVVMTTIADSFAGERERHTLETLLASRLSDRAILFGKIGAAVTYALGLTLIMVLAGLLTVNVAYWQGRLLFFPAAFALAGIAVTLLMACLAASLGVLVSLRAATVRQAQQVLGFIMLFVFFGPIFALQWLPGEMKLVARQALEGADLAQTMLIGGLALIVINAALLTAALARFQRARLILD